MPANYDRFSQFSPSHLRRLLAGIATMWWRFGEDEGADKPRRFVKSRTLYLINIDDYMLFHEHNIIFKNYLKI
jgi:hypothetical protein